MKTKNVDSIAIGKYLGPVLSLLLITEMINFHIWDTPGNPQLVYLNGFVLLLFGFYIVRIHNLWVRGWPVFITLSGWFFTILGLLRMFFPDAKQASESTATFIGLGVLIAIEIYVTFKAYSSRDYV